MSDDFHNPIFSLLLKELPRGILWEDLTRKEQQKFIGGWRPNSSQQETIFNRIKARIDRSKVKVKIETKVKSEHAEQAVFMSRISFEYPTVLAYAVPNAAKRGIWEAAQKKAEGLKTGIPDAVFAEARGGYFGLYMEFKRSDQMRAINGGLTEDQIKIRAQLTARGYRVETVYSAAMAMERFQEYMRLPLTIASLASFAR